MPAAEYNLDNYHGRYIRLVENASLLTAYCSGKYVITGANSVKELFETSCKVLKRL